MTETADCFSEWIFQEYEPLQVMKGRMNGFEDPTLKDFSFLGFSAVAVEEAKEDKFEMEFIESFLKAAEVIAEEGKRAIDLPGVYVIFRALRCF